MGSSPDSKEIFLGERVIAYLTDFALGFFFLPYFIFISRLTSALARGSQISDGEALIYVALLSGTYYVLKRDVYIFLGIKISNLVVIICGLALFVFTTYHL